MPNIPTCHHCGSAFLHGEPLHVFDMNGQPTLWCEECIDAYTAAVWPDDTRGPYPFTIQHRERPPRDDA